MSTNGGPRLTDVIGAMEDRIHYWGVGSVRYCPTVPATFGDDKISMGRVHIAPEYQNWVVLDRFMFLELKVYHAGDPAVAPFVESCMLRSASVTMRTSDHCGLMHLGQQCVMMQPGKRGISGITHGAIKFYFPLDAGTYASADVKPPEFSIALPSAAEIAEERVRWMARLLISPSSSTAAAAEQGSMLSCLDEHTRHKIFKYARGACESRRGGLMHIRTMCIRGSVYSCAGSAFCMQVKPQNYYAVRPDMRFVENCGGLGKMMLYRGGDIAKYVVAYYLHLDRHVRVKSIDFLGQKWIAHQLERLNWIEDGKAPPPRRCQINGSSWVYLKIYGGLPPGTYLPNMRAKIECSEGFMFVKFDRVCRAGARIVFYPVVLVRA